MRILVCHSVYQHRGGEDAVVEAEVDLLQRHGHDVEVYLRHNVDLQHTGKLRIARDTLWSPRTAQELPDMVSRFQPDLIHVHNTFPTLSASLYWAADRLRVPVVQTLHNFRTLCVQAMFLRDDRVCEDCLGKLPWRGVVHGCYNGSPVQSAVLCASLGLHRLLGTYRNKIDRYIALNDFCRKKFVEGGLPAERISIKPNFVDLAPLPPPSTRDGILFVGRLSREKGIATLAEACGSDEMGSGLGVVKVAGSGPERHRLESLASVYLLGALGPDEVYQQMRNAQALVVPSIWYENFPRTIVEAFACGLPVIASRLGALPELVQDGITGMLFDPGNACDLREKLLWAQSHPQEMGRMGDAARRHYEQYWTGSANYALLMSIYEEVLARNPVSVAAS